METESDRGTQSHGAVGEEVAFSFGSQNSCLKQILRDHFFLSFIFSAFFLHFLSLETKVNMDFFPCTPSQSFRFMK